MRSSGWQTLMAFLTESSIWIDPMSDLRKKLIRLAYQNPGLQGDLLPLLKESRRRYQQGDRVRLRQTQEEGTIVGMSGYGFDAKYKVRIVLGPVVEVSANEMLPSFRRASALQNFDGGTYDVKAPLSLYDSSMAVPAFKWSTPAKNYDGSYPMPWRYADAEAAEKFLKGFARKRFPESQRDLYVVSNSDWAGYKTLWLGLRDNRDKQAHQARLEKIYRELTKAKAAKLRMEDGWIMIIDDLKKEALG